MDTEILAETWRGLRSACPNVLIIGDDVGDDVGGDATHHRTVTALLEGSRPPVWWCDGERFALPTETVGTLVLQNPAALPAKRQRALLKWAIAHSKAQIITVTHRPLYPLVQAAAFLDDLYYWLNVVTIPA